jgi:hypothetical protein
MHAFMIGGLGRHESNVLVWTAVWLDKRQHFAHERFNRGASVLAGVFAQYDETQGRIGGLH